MGSRRAPLPTPACRRSRSGAMRAPVHCASRPGGAGVREPMAGQRRDDSGRVASDGRAGSPERADTAADVSAHRIRRAGDRDRGPLLSWPLSVAWRGLQLYTPLRGLALSGPEPFRLYAAPADPLPGDPALGTTILSGALPGRGGNSGVGDGEPWLNLARRSVRHQWFVHSFEWLPDLMAAADRDAAQELGVQLIRDWVARYPGPGADPQAWHPHATARRLIAWTAHAQLVQRAAARTPSPNALTAMARQARHLRLVYPRRGHLPARIVALSALLMAALALDMPELKPRRLARHVAHLLDLFLHDDGGPISRQPAHAVGVLRILMLLRELHRARGLPQPAWIGERIRAVVSFLRGISLGDGSLARFNGGTAMSAAAVLHLLHQADPAAPVRVSARATGFERLSAGGVTCVIDSGPPPPPDLSTRAGAGTLSFEMSDGDYPLVVNMGSASQHGLPEKLTSVARATAAHSTLVIDDTNSTRAEADGLRRGVESVGVRRAVSEAGTLLDLAHDGYRHRLGVVHERQLFLAGDGKRLVGADRLVGAGRNKLAIVDLRFHLHPRVGVRVSRDGLSADLSHPGGRAWRFRADGRVVKTEESLFIDADAGPVRTKQLVVRVAAPVPADALRWSLERITLPRAAGDA
ncbi:hypothetical protein CCR80_10255 [Rhodothalassium salexigens]|nr:hypothetical protein [Rhodothalassium salexigens]